ncbi:hypothetical protein, variant 1 [Spizellomyces punctatus DAOM BR117]|uniref:RecQ-mediated genome instability protein 1 n=2 Tax=Spizellomyces punctatus (strain DAOM BR117) TaxID=645134 RepID=A0A0L0HRI0_SPIPD|nr:hypothetical protein, variant 1 [Spizellomyces punctatus DAOM BR117]KND03677.1 hypothetical protein, variant 1 [Spizellomyces punctatus DAOM BR117]|eukprot:XP_016611716.1 hypothetical protein, variant 1 [Spizellomyces punctatus DAOM BR117]
MLQPSPIIPSTVQQRLAAKNIQIHPHWTEQCINYLRTRSPISLTDSDLVDGILEQYLHTDLREVGLPVLPPRITEAHKVVVGRPKGIVLQVIDVHEVGVSANSMLELILDFKPKKGEPPRPQHSSLQIPRKMLRLQLTDGVQEVPAMECALLPGISVESMLGVKVVVTNATIRQGVIMLEPQNFSILGGYVASMNVDEPLVRLEKKCKAFLKYVNSPQRTDSIPTRNDGSAPDRQGEATVAGSESYRILSSVDNRHPRGQSTEGAQSLRPDASIAHPGVTAHSAKDEDAKLEDFPFDDDDFDLDAFDFDLGDVDVLLQEEAGYSAIQSNSNVLSLCSIKDEKFPQLIDLTSDGAIPPISNRQNDSGVPAQTRTDLKPASIAPTSVGAIEMKQEGRLNSSHSSPSGFSVFKELSTRQRLSHPHELQSPPNQLGDNESSSPAKKPRLSSPNRPNLIQPATAPPRLGYLCNIETIVASRSHTRIHVKAHIDNWETLRLQRSGYSLIVVIDDGTSLVRAGLANHLIEGFFGLSASEAKKRKQADGYDTLSEAVNRFSQFLKDLDCVLELDLSACRARNSQQGSSGSALDDNLPEVVAFISDNADILRGMLR